LSNGSYPEHVLFHLKRCTLYSRLTCWSTSCPK
jgi:hypothetical protein